MCLRIERFSLADRAAQRRRSWLLAACLAATSGQLAAADPPPPKPAPMKIEITSPAFREGQPIPARHTADGEDASPPLQWTNVPPGAKSLALIADDPDAPVGTWVHWVLYDLPPATRELAEDVPRTQYLPGGAKQGLNDFRRLGYGGPSPPRGQPHRYCFKLYALDKLLDLRPGLTKSEVLKAMEGHVVGEGVLMGTYQRR